MRYSSRLSISRGMCGLAYARYMRENLTSLCRCNGETIAPVSCRNVTILSPRLKNYKAPCVDERVLICRWFDQIRNHWIGCTRVCTFHQTARDRNPITKLHNELRHWRQAWIAILLSILAFLDKCPIWQINQIKVHRSRGVASLTIDRFMRNVRCRDTRKIQWLRQYDRICSPKLPSYLNYFRIKFKTFAFTFARPNRVSRLYGRLVLVPLLLNLIYLKDLLYVASLDRLISWLP